VREVAGTRVNLRSRMFHTDKIADVVIAMVKIDGDPAVKPLNNPCAIMGPRNATEGVPFL
jgi:hypothetical protein